MHAPVLVTPPDHPPVSLSEMKDHLKREASETYEDGIIAAYIDAAASHFDGWSGILGKALCQQTWQQDHDGIERCIRLPLGPVISVTSITVRNKAGQLSTISSDDYAVFKDALGSYVRFKSSASLPSDLYEKAAVRVTWTCGHPKTVGENPVSTVPAAIKAAIMLLVAHWHKNREAVNVGNIVNELPFAVDALIAPFRVRVL